MEIPEALKTELDGMLEEHGKVLDGLARPTGKPFWSEGPRLGERLQGLFSQLNGVLVAPTNALLAYFEELSSEYREKMGAVNRFFGERATALSSLLEQNGAPGLLLPASIPLTN